MGCMGVIFSVPTLVMTFLHVINILFHHWFSNVLVEIARMTEVQSGESVKDLFQGFLKKHSLDKCISIKFGDNGSCTALNMVAESSEVADYWVRGLQKLIVNKGTLMYYVTGWGEVTVQTYFLLYFQISLNCQLKLKIKVNFRKFDL